MAAQRASIRAYAAFKGMALVEEIEDAGVSAGKNLQKRSGGARLFELASRPEVGAVIAFKLDRLFRDAADCLEVTREWDELEVNLHLVDLGGQPVDTSTAMGRFFLTIMAGVAEMERNLIRERTKAAMAHLKATGKRAGAIPYGFDLAADGKTLLENEKEQEVIALAKAFRAKGLSLEKISLSLDSMGKRSRKNKRFYREQIKRMLG